MYYVSKRMEIAGSHSLTLGYKSPCQNLHGHNWIITVYCKAERLNDYGMVVDFKMIEDIVRKKMEHKLLNDVFSFNPTAENIARWIADRIPFCYRVSVQESEGNKAIYEK